VRSTVHVIIAVAVAAVCCFLVSSTKLTSAQVYIREWWTLSQSASCC